MSVQRTLLKIILLLAFFPFCTPAAQLQIIKGGNTSGKIYLHPLFDDAPQRAFLDTGSAATIVADTGHFSRYPKIGQLRFTSAAAIEQAIDKIQLHSLQLDDLILTNPTIGRANFPKAETTLGIDLLNRQPFALSVKNKNLTLNPPRPDTPFTTLQVSPQGLLSIPITVGSTQLQALWDTGAGLTTVDQSFIQSNPNDFTPTKKYMHGTDGAGKPLLVQIFRAKKITVGQKTFQNLSPNIQAVLGHNLIAKVDWYFDPKTRLWQIDKNR
jgi:hypothetical protein